VLRGRIARFDALGQCTLLIRRQELATRCANRALGPPSPMTKPCVLPATAALSTTMTATTITTHIRTPITRNPRLGLTVE
jgi:hypothetical protein